MVEPKGESKVVDAAQKALLSAGEQRFVEGAIALKDEFVAEHALQLTVLREDAEGLFRNPGLLRLLIIPLLIASVVPFFAQAHRRFAGGGYEFAGMIASCICAALLLVIVLRSGGRPYDKHSFITFYWTAFSCGGGAVLAWMNGVPEPLLTQFSIAAALVVVLVLVLQFNRSRSLSVARMRDEDAMDRSARLREDLSARLRSYTERNAPSGQEETVQEFLTGLVDGTIPKPRNRTFTPASEPTSE